MARRAVQGNVIGLDGGLDGLLDTEPLRQMSERHGYSSLLLPVVAVKATLK